MTVEQAMASLPDPVRRRVVELVDNQGALAMSPVEENNDGRIVMCAATCVAYAVLDTAGDTSAAATLLRQLASDRGGIAPVVEVLGSVGWTPQVSQAVMSNNDKIPPARRVEWFMELCA
jgi:hypothetical protein